MAVEAEGGILRSGTPTAFGAETDPGHGQMEQNRREACRGRDPSSALQPTSLLREFHQGRHLRIWSGYQRYEEPGWFETVLQAGHSVLQPDELVQGSGLGMQRPKRDGPDHPLETAVDSRAARKKRPPCESKARSVV